MLFVSWLIFSSPLTYFALLSSFPCLSSQMSSANEVKFMECVTKQMQHLLTYKPSPKDWSDEHNDSRAELTVEERCNA